MVNLKDYIQEQLKAGYEINTVRHYLQKYGYSVKAIETAIQSLYAPPKPKHPPWKIIIPSVSILIAIIAISFFALKPPVQERPAKLLDLELEKVTDIASIGEEFEFKVNLFNFGVIPRFDVFLEHQLLDEQENIIQETKETIAVETRVSKITTINLPEDLTPGLYSIKTIARYEGLLATAQIPFQAEVFKECPESCDDEDRCTEDLCGKRTNFECYHVQIPDCVPPEEEIPEEPVPKEEIPPLPPLDETIPVEEKVVLPKAPIRKKNSAEIIEEIRLRASEDPENAIKDCDSLLEEQSDKDFCFESIAST